MVPAGSCCVFEPRVWPMSQANSAPPRGGFLFISPPSSPIAISRRRWRARRATGHAATRSVAVAVGGGVGPTVLAPTPVPTITRVAEIGVVRIVVIVIVVVERAGAEGGGGEEREEAPVVETAVMEADKAVARDKAVADKSAAPHKSVADKAVAADEAVATDEPVAAEIAVEPRATLEAGGGANRCAAEARATAAEAAATTAKTGATAEATATAAEAAATTTTAEAKATAAAVTATPAAATRGSDVNHSDARKRDRGHARHYCCP